MTMIPFRSMMGGEPAECCKRALLLLRSTEKGVNLFGLADNFESSRANEREAEWKCKRKETVENGLPCDADTAESHEDSQFCAEFVAKTGQYGRRQIDTVIRCLS
jgi:hypothetical protein